MDKKIQFSGLERFRLPECTTIPNTKYDEYGNASGIILIKYNSDRYIEYTNDKNVGITTVTAPNKDLIAALMELGDSPTENELAEFFSKYGFFLSSESLSDTKYTEFSVESLTYYINYIQKIIKLINFHAKYIASAESEKTNLDYCKACNILIDVLFSHDVHLNGSLPSSENTLGYNYANNFEECCKECHWPRSVPVYEYTSNNEIDFFLKTYGEYPEPTIKGHTLIEPFEDFLDFCINGNAEYNFSSQLPFPPNIIYTNKEKELFHFLEELLNNNYLKYENDINDYYFRNQYFNTEQGIPHVINLNQNDIHTLTLQKEFMSLLPEIINIQINAIIQNVYPIIEYDQDKSVKISWKFNNLLCVIFMELVNIEMGGFECRNCCKDNCPIKGSYYFIVDAKNNSRLCCEKKCRTKINKRLFDEKKKKSDETSVCVKD